MPGGRRNRRGGRFLRNGGSLINESRRLSMPDRGIGR